MTRAEQIEVLARAAKHVAETRTYHMDLVRNHVTYGCSFCAILDDLISEEIRKLLDPK